MYIYKRKAFECNICACCQFFLLTFMLLVLFFFFFWSDCKQKSVSNCTIYIRTHTFVRKSLKLRTIPLGVRKNY